MPSGKNQESVIDTGPAARPADKPSTQDVADIEYCESVRKEPARPIDKVLKDLGIKKSEVGL